MTDKIGLSEFINTLKNELNLVNQDSKIFLIDKVDLEIKVTASRKTSLEGSVEGKLDIKINVIPGLSSVELGEISGSGKGSGEFTRQDVHTVKLSLTPAIFKKELIEMLDKGEIENLKKNTKKQVFLGSDQPSNDPI
jgi:hypothetical protein